MPSKSTISIGVSSQFTWPKTLLKTDSNYFVNYICDALSHSTNLELTTSSNSEYISKYHNSKCYWGRINEKVDSFVFIRQVKDPN